MEEIMMEENKELLTSNRDSHDYSDLIFKLSEMQKKGLEKSATEVTSLIAASSILRESENNAVYTAIFERIQKGEIKGDADDFHNIAVDYARHEQPDRASAICQTGLRTWPNSIDLNADALTYMLDSGDLNSSSKLAESLQNNCPDRSKWNWRGFSFLFDYYLKVQPSGYEEAIDTLIDDYKKYLPYEEKAYICDAKRYINLGQTDQAINSLENALSRLNAPQSALFLTDLYFESAKYEDAIRTATLGIAYAAEPQPSIRTAYLLFIRALSKDALYLKNGSVSQEEAKQILGEYELARRYVSKSEEEVINLRMDILKTYSSLNDIQED